MNLKTFLFSLNKSNSKFLPKQSKLLYPLSTIITSLSNYIILIFLWKKLGPGEFGVLMILDLLPLIIMSFMTFSLDQYVMRHYYEWSKTERNFNLFYIWRLSIIISSITLIISTILVILFQDLLFLNRGYFTLCILTIINVYITAIYNVPFSAIRITEKAMDYFSVKMISLVFYVLSIIFFVFIFDLKLKGYFYSLILSSFSHLISTLFVQRNIFFYKKPQEGKLEISNIYNYCVPLIPANLLGSSIGIIERFFLQKYLKLEEIGFYSMANKFVEIINQTHGIMKLSYGPALFKNVTSRSLKENNFAKSVKNHIFPIFFSFVMIFSFSLPLMKILRINNADSIFAVMFFLSFSVLINTLQIYLAPGPIVFKKTEVKLILDVFNTSLISAIVYFSLKYFDLIAMLQFKILAALLYLFLSVVFTRKYMKWDIDINFLIFNSIFILIISIINYIDYRLEMNIIFLVFFLIINIYKHKIKFELNV